MKHFVKWMLGLAVVFLVVGVGFVIAGVTLGAGFAEADFLNEMGSRVLHIRDYSRIESFIKGEEDVENLSDLLITDEEPMELYEEYEGKLRTEHGTHDGGSTYKLSTVKNLEIDLKAGELYMEAYSGNEIKVQVEHEDKKYVKVSSGEDFLKIEGLKKIHSGDVVVYYPKDLKLDQLKIEIDAGTIVIEDEISADLLNISIGAGELDADGKLYTETAMIEVGAGEVNIEWISTDTLEGSCGIGEMSLCLEGKEKDYNYYLECGLGEIQIGDNTHSSIADHQEIRNDNTDKKISLSCGMGEIEIDFAN